MLTTVEGVYRHGRIELAERPADVDDGTRVFVTFLSSPGIDLRTRGMSTADAAELRARLDPFAAEWDSPEMSLYDEYDASLARE